MLTLDESGDERAGAKSAGAARQYLGRLGKVEMGQVGVALGVVACKHNRLDLQTRGFSAHIICK
jgi:SRSO17 transposase